MVDIGCYSHPSHEGQSQDSITRLIERFQPATVYGFDPYPALVEVNEDRAGVHVQTARKAAWAWDGTIPYVIDKRAPLTSAVSAGPGDYQVPCFDLGRWMTALPYEAHDVVLKIDAEGAEYVLLERLINLDVDEWLRLLLVEWHGDRAEDRARLEAALRCPLEVWA